MIRRPRLPGRWMVGGVGGLGAGALVAAVATIAVSAAAYYDHANMNLGMDGIGSNNRFDIAVVKADDTVIQADAPAGVNWAIPGSDKLVPGRSVTTDIPVFNNSPALGADVVMTVLADGDGSVGTAPNITSLLLFSAELSDGTSLFSEVSLAQASASMGTLVARGADALEEGDAYTPGEAGSEEVVTLTVAYPDENGVEDYNGGQSALRIRFDAESA
ncbi:MAG: hypothetical protein QM628_02720 [Propionicimonas sp.]